jgi:hypothetical protein
MTGSRKRLPAWLLLMAIGLFMAALFVYVVLGILGK